MGFLKKIFKKQKTSPTTELEQLKKREADHQDKSMNKDYYFSEEAAKTGKQIYHDKKEYVKNNPEDYDIVAAQIFQVVWSYVETLPPEERKIYTLTGQGKYYEDQEDYEKAIEYYQQADDLTMQVCKKEIDELVKDHGPGDYLYCGKIRQRIRVCQKPLIKKIELEAKELEKTNPQKAIELYNELNTLRPGLKKYDKRIKVCENLLEKSIVKQ